MANPKLILGLDISTVCVGVSIVLDEGKNEPPKVLLLTHISPKVSKKLDNFESLVLKKDIFEKEFLETLKASGITDCVIEEPLISSNNAYTVAALLRFNGMIGDAVHRALGIFPTFISSHDARTYSFPELVALRKYDKKGKEYSFDHVKSAIKKNHIVLFGDYPFDIDKKDVMMNKVNDLYPDITWVLNKKGEIKKENFDACDSLVCALAYINLYRNGDVKEPPVISSSIIHQQESVIEIDYVTSIWNRTYEKKLILHK